MATVKPLSATKVRAAKFDPSTPANNTLRDGQGLELRITKTAKSWLFKYYRPDTGARTNISFGQFPDVSLEKAREKRQEARALLADGIDPQRHRDSKQEATKAAAENTLIRIAERWIELKRHETSAAHCDASWRRLERFIFPALGGTPISKIDVEIVLSTVQHLETAGKLTTLHRILADIRQIVTLAIQRGIVTTGNPFHGITKAIKSPKKRAMASIPPAELPGLMMSIAESGADFTTKQAILFSLHTLVRPSEVAGARWDEIDLDAGWWTIPAERMKMKREHVVPLTAQAIKVLRDIHQLSGNREHVFPHRANPKRPMNKQSTNVALARMGYAGRLVAHGIRALGATAMSQHGFPYDLIDACLAHVVGNTTSRAYIRDDLAEARIPLMRWWSNTIEAASERGEVPVVQGRRMLMSVA